MNKHRLAIFASGSGSNAENIIRNFIDNKYIEISLVLTNNPKAGVIKRANDLKVPVIIFSKNEFFNTNIISDLLIEKKIDFIILAGFLLLLPIKLITRYPDKIINIHPALLPKYGGKGMYGDRVHQAVKENNETSTGITIHYVDEKYDNGKIIFQASCPVDTDQDSISDIASKVHDLEHKFFPEIIEREILKSTPHKRSNFV